MTHSLSVLVCWSVCLSAVSGDVVGMLLCVDERDVSHNAIHFSLNGCWQAAAAFTAFPLTPYYPAVSAYQCAQLHCRFQPPYLFQSPWVQPVVRGVTVNWRAEVVAVKGQMSYRYWRRDKKAKEKLQPRQGCKTRVERTVYETD